jgi:hypothetical protein
MQQGETTALLDAGEGILTAAPLGPFRNATIPGTLPKPWRFAHCTMSEICLPAVFFQHFSASPAQSLASGWAHYQNVAKRAYGKSGPLQSGAGPRVQLAILAPGRKRPGSHGERASPDECHTSRVG